MPLIVAIEPDAAQVALLSTLAPRHVDAEIVLVPTVDRALRVLDTRVPDLLLTPMLLSARDDAALTARVRELDDRGIAVPVLVIPVLAADQPAEADAPRATGLLTLIRKPKAVAPRPKGCTPEVFAQQIVEYLAHAAAERREREDVLQTNTWTTAETTATAPLLAEWLTAQDSTPFLPAALMPPEPMDVPPLAPEEEAPEPSVALVTAVAAPEPGEELEEPTVDHAADELSTPLPAEGLQVLAPLPEALPEPMPVVQPEPQPALTPTKAERGATAFRPKRAPRTERAPTPDKPMQDEWGLYDPEQCGFAALLDRLDEITAAGGETGKRRKRSAIMRR